MMSSSIFTFTIVSLTIVVSNAFTAPIAGHIHPSTSSSFITHNPRSNALPAVLDGILYESSQFEAEYDPTELCCLALIPDDDTHQQQQPDSYVIDCLTNIVGMPFGDAYDAIVQSQGIAKVSELGEFPRHTAELMYEELTAKGIPVGMC
eukprot:scaffold248441_cov63-Cyclotella_meneghiniana.AAC.5